MGIPYIAVLRIRFILVSRIRFNEMDPDPDSGSKKSVKIMENFNKNPPKSLEYHFFLKTIKLVFTDINI